jgi:hypothetical protein
MLIISPLSRKSYYIPGASVRHTAIMELICAASISLQALDVKFFNGALLFFYFHFLLFTIEIVFLSFHIVSFLLL